MRDFVVRHLIVGLDQSRGWTAVLAAALLLGTAADTSVEAIRVVGRETSLSERDRMASEIRDVARSLRSTPAIAAEVIVGSPERELRRASVGAELLVLGARGATSGRRLLLGSVVQSLLQSAGCPVVVVRDLDGAANSPLSAGTIGVGAGPGGPDVLSV